MVRVCQHWLSAAAIPFVASLLAGAQTAPSPNTTRPGASAATRPDYSSPPAAVRSFLLAYKAQDEEGMRAVLLVPEGGREDAETLLELLSSTNRMVRAFTAAYGAAASSRQLGASPALLIEDRLKAVETAEPQIDGSSATIRIPSDEQEIRRGGTIRLQKTADGWKLDVASVLGLSVDNPNLAATLRVARALIPVTKSMAADVEKHKFASAQDAAQEFWTRSSAAIVSSTRPETTPTTAPSTSPGEARQ